MLSDLPPQRDHVRTLNVAVAVGAKRWKPVAALIDEEIDVLPDRRMHRSLKPLAAEAGYFDLAHPSERAEVVTCASAQVDGETNLRAGRETRVVRIESPVVAAPRDAMVAI